jgi:hypothetical protein
MVFSAEPAGGIVLRDSSPCLPLPPRRSGGISHVARNDVIAPVPPVAAFSFSNSRVILMTELEQGELRVVVPVGFLLQEEQEVSVSVNRPNGQPLPIRLRLIPARPASATVISDADDTPLAIGWPTRKVLNAVNAEDGYPAPEYGGGD